MTRPRILLAFWILSDLLLFLASYALAYFERVGWILSTDFPFRPYIAVAAIVAPFWLSVLLATRSLSLLHPQRTLWSALSHLYAAIVGSALFALVYFFLFGLFFSRLLLLEAFALSLVIPFLWHLLYERILRSVLRRDPPSFPTLIVGVTRESKRLIAHLQRTRNPLKPVAILDGQGAKEKDINGVPVIGKLDKLDATMREHRITHLIHCSDVEQSLNLLSACHSHGATFLLLPSVLGVVERHGRTESLEGWAVLMVHPRRTA
jgi:FlaA1/EpsC-like NDP-sugar epimerase